MFGPPPASRTLPLRLEVYAAHPVRGRNLVPDRGTAPRSEAYKATASLLMLSRRGASVGIRTRFHSLATSGLHLAAKANLVDRSGLEPDSYRVSGGRLHQLSYRSLALLHGYDPCSPP